MTGPIFLLSSERSGTNLLRQRVSEVQTSICSPPPVHILRTLYPWYPIMGDFSDDNVWKNVIQYTLRCCYERAIPWDVKITESELFDSYQTEWPHKHDRNLILLMHQLYSVYSTAKNSDTYFCKDLWLFDFAYQIKSFIPDSNFVHLYRDPRDYILSQRRRPFGEQSVIKLAKRWLSECNASMRITNSPGFYNHTYTLSYESLIKNEELQISEILKKFNIEKELNNSEQTIYQFHEWKNLHKRTITHNYNKYKTGLSIHQIKAIESICWNTMKFLGYKTEFKTRPDINSLYAYYETMMSSLVTNFKKTYNRYRLRNEPINRRATNKLVEELSKLYR